MGKAVYSFFMLFLFLYTSNAQEKVAYYLGETPPKEKAKLFFKGELVVHKNKEKRSFNLAFSPNGKELFFSYYKGTKELPYPEYEIKTFKLKNGFWIGPVTASFSGKFSDVDINFSTDGNHIFFASDRPQPHSAGLDIYYSIKTKEGWSEPIYAGAEVNSIYGEVYPSVSSKKNLFFRSSRPSGFGEDDLYRAEWINDRFINVKNLGPNINSQYGESNAVISADESYIVFCSARSEDRIEHIYVSFQLSDNNWTKAIALGSEVNSKSGAGAPTLSADGKYLFFKKRMEPERGLYWVSTSIIDDLRPEEPKQ